MPKNVEPESTPNLPDRSPICTPKPSQRYNATTLQRYNATTLQRYNAWPVALEARRFGRRRRTDEGRRGVRGVSRSGGPALTYLAQRVQTGLAVDGVHIQRVEVAAHGLCRPTDPPFPLHAEWHGGPPPRSHCRMRGVALPHPLRWLCGALAARVPRSRGAGDGVCGASRRVRRMPLARAASACALFGESPAGRPTCGVHCCAGGTSFGTA